jgi:TonB family protein
MSKLEASRSWEGRVIEGKFPLRQWLGGSPHSAVFLTEFPGQPSQKAAIKLIRVDDSQCEPLLCRLQATRKLSHPHLIRTLECGLCRIEELSYLYAVMECADDDLSQILPQRPLEPQEVSNLLPPVLDALSYLHRNGFVHGRVKPSNVLAAGDQLKLSSDQAAPVAQQNGQHRRRDVYDAPETAAGIISPAGDLWSVGATLVAALTQNVTLAEDTSPANRDLPETIPEPFRGIVRECLQLDPDRRGSLKEIQERMHPVAEPVDAARPGPALLDEAPVADSEDRRPIRIAAALVIVVAGILLVVSLGVFRSRSNQSPETRAATSQAATATAPLPAAAAPPPPAAALVPAEPPKPAAATPTHRATGGEVVRRVLPDVSRHVQKSIRGTIRVVVRVRVDPSGKVTSAKFQWRGSSRYFADRALKAAQRWEFSAPEVNGEPRASTWLLQFRFNRKSIQATPQRVRG